MIGATVARSGDEHSCDQWAECCRSLRLFTAGPDGLTTLWCSSSQTQVVVVVLQVLHKLVLSADPSLGSSPWHWSAVWRLQWCSGHSSRQKVDGCGLLWCDTRRLVIRSWGCRCGEVFCWSGEQLWSTGGVQAKKRCYCCFWWLLVEGIREQRQTEADQNWRMQRST